MTNGFPAKPSDSGGSINYSHELEETLDNVKCCFKVFVCRYSRYTIRGALPVIQRIFMELVELLENCLLDLKQMEHNKTSNDASQDNRRVDIFGKVDVYNNMVLLMYLGIFMLSISALNSFSTGTDSSRSLLLRKVILRSVLQ